MDPFPRTSSTPSEQDNANTSEETLTPADIMFSLILFVMFAGSVFCYRQKRRERRVQPSSQTTPREVKKQKLAKRKEEIKEHLKVYVYNDGEKKMVDTAVDDIDIEAQEGKKEDPHCPDPSGSEDEPYKAECAVCLCPFESGQKVCEANNSSCRHTFHETCMMAWLLKHRECPICRQDYLDIEDSCKDGQE